jgi:arginyl-tRNA synthetase
MTHTTSASKEIAAFLLQELEKAETLEKILENLSPPPSVEQGDYAYACFSAAKTLQKNPAGLSRELAEKFKPSRFVEKADTCGPYLNFFVNKKFYQKEIIDHILKQKESYGHSRIGKGEKILIEYSSPNIAKPFHIGHFRATIIGNALKKIHLALGYKCIGINYLGDWGTQFGKLITAFKKWGDEAKLSDPQVVKYLNSLYVRFHEEVKQDPSLEDEARLWFKKCEENDREAIRLWKKFKSVSLKEFKKIYDFLGITFDAVSAESEYNDDIEKTIALLKEKTPAKISEGALIVDLEPYHLPPALILRSDGASLYLTRDTAALLDRYSKYRFDRMIYVVGDTQSLHFKQLFKLIEMMKYDWASRCFHVAFGQIRLKEQKISTRQGATILLEDLLSKAISLIQKIIEEKNPKLKNKREVSERVGLSALIFADFGSKRIKNVVFDWDIILNPDGDTGPYVMYTYARASSILRKALKIKTKPTRQKTLYIPLYSIEEQELIRYLERFPKTIQLAAQNFEPSYIASYLIELSKLFNRFYHEHRVIQEDAKLQAARLKLVSAVRSVIQNGLHLIGVKEVEEL